MVEWANIKCNPKRLRCTAQKVTNHTFCKKAVTSNVECNELPPNSNSILKVSKLDNFFSFVTLTFGIFTERNSTTGTVDTVFCYANTIQGCILSRQVGSLVIICAMFRSCAVGALFYFDFDHFHLYNNLNILKNVLRVLACSAYYYGKIYHN